MKRTKAMARELRAMASNQKVQRNARRVATKLRAFAVGGDGEIARREIATRA